MPNQVQPGVRFTPNWIELPERELDQSEVITGGAVDVGNGDDDHLKLHIKICNARTSRLFVFADFPRAHC